ncbi:MULTISPECIES: type IV toxin-antitoxin system AbiEi family antitoxin [unclassified Pedobacter]|uniref:type IV toxin-antitoxin system AbiEi family antitoxin n=1 Tax=unclassified Pedobacter TaxID=2628915 RepID=UPI001E33EEAA|nr:MULTISPECIES: type IV toxin-antitoxin system AbiEi family antitoxin [unclassified Pedobacter]
MISVFEVNVVKTNVSLADQFIYMFRIFRRSSPKNSALINQIVYIYLSYRRSSPKTFKIVNMPIDSKRRKNVFRLVPEGVLVSRKWLLDHELSNHAIDNLLKSNQLTTVKNGIYKREGSIVDWGDVVYFLQRAQKTDLTIGGITALELQKLSHYLALSKKRTVHLYGKEALPGWLNRATDSANFIKHSLTDLLGQPVTQTLQGQLYNFTKTLSWKDSKEGLRLSTPERAILEVLNDVPAKISFEHADELMQGLTTLSPRALQQLLEIFNNVKVRRLFFYFAEKQNHPWLAKLNKAGLSFGSGNRVVAKGGHLNKKYQITVPASYE